MSECSGYVVDEGGADPALIKKIKEVARGRAAARARRPTRAASRRQPSRCSRTRLVTPGRQVRGHGRGVRGPGNHVLGANIAGFRRAADAILAFGVI